MNRFLLALTLFFFGNCVYSQTCSNTQVGSSGFYCVKASTGTGTTSAAVTFASGYPANSTIVVEYQANTVTVPTSGNLSNTAGYSWTFWGYCGSNPVALWYHAITSADVSSDTITVTNATASYSEVDAAVYTGAGAIDGAGVCNPLGASGSSNNNYTVTVGDLNIGLISSTSSTISGAGSGWNLRAEDSGTYVIFEDQVAASTTANPTWGGGTVANVIGVAFKAAPSSTHTAIPIVF